MKYYDLVQGSPEWFAARAGIPTTSRFGDIITPKKREYSKSAGAYQNMLIAELIMGDSLDKFPPSFWMERGAQMEDAAAALYEFNTGETLHRGGFCTLDDDSAGASPDRRILNDDGTIKGLIEIKCPAPWNHVENLLIQQIDMDYYPQVQGQMLVTGAQWVDFFSYHPDMPPAHVRTPRDEEFIEQLRACLVTFNDGMQAKLKTLLALGAFKEIPQYKRPEVKNAFWEQPIEDGEPTREATTNDD